MHVSNVPTLHILEIAVFISLSIEGTTESLQDYSHAMAKCLISVFMKVCSCVHFD